MLVCVLIADFAAQAERRAAPSRAPLLLTTGPTRPIVAALDQRAGAQGVRRGMPVKRARALCPEAEIRPLVETRLQPVFEAALDIIGEFAARFEVQPSLAGADPLFWLDIGAAHDLPALVQQLRTALRDHAGLAAEFGAATSKFPALAAAASGGVTLLPEGRERAFLAPQPVSLLPLLPEEARRLDLYGLRRLGQLADLPRPAVMAQFGLRGRLLHQLACGEDPRPLNPYQAPRVERFRRRFPDALADEGQIEHALKELSGEAVRRLQETGSACGKLTLCLTFETGSAAERVRVLRRPLAELREFNRALQELGASLAQAGVTQFDLELGALVAEQPRQLNLFDAPQAKTRTTRELARLLSARHSAVCVQAVLPEEADLLPELVTFAPLEAG